MRGLCLVGLLAVILAPGAAAQAPSKEAPLAPAPAPLLPVLAKPWTGDLDGMVQRRVIRVATTYNRTNYFIDRGQQRGAVYESFRLFEDELNTRLKTKNLRVQVVFIPMSRDELLKSVVEGRADIAAATLTVTPDRQKIVDFVPATYSEVNEIVVTGPGAPAIKSAEDLSGKEVFVRRSSSYAESLNALNAQLKAKGRPPVTIKPAPEELETEDILEMTNAGLVKMGFTVYKTYRLLDRPL